MANITDILRDMLKEEQADVTDPKEILENSIQSIKSKLEEDDLDEDVIAELEENLEELEEQLAEEFPPKKDDDDDEEDDDKDDDKKVDEEFPPKKKDDDDDDDDKDDDEDDMDESALVPHIDAIKNLFKDQELSEETLEKLGTLFSAAVTSLTNEKVKTITDTLEEDNAKELTEAIAEIDEKIDTYISYAAVEYMKENEIAIEQGIKTELVESFLIGMKELFNEHYVDIPEDKVDIIAELGVKLEEADDKLDVLIEENISNKLEINKFKKAETLTEMLEDLADTDKEKVETLSEGIEFIDKETFIENIRTLRENYLFKKEKVNEDIKDKDDKKVLTEMDSYLSAVSNNSKF